MRVLHIIDPGSPGGGACTLQLLAEPLARLNSVHQDVLLIGTARHEMLARRCGVAPIGRLNTPRNEPMLAGIMGRAFRDLVELYESRNGRYDIIHTWTARSTLLTAVATPSHARLATLAVGPVNGVMMAALARALKRRPCSLLATSVSVKRDYMVTGIAEEYVDVLPPAVHPEAVEEHSEDRETVRRRWGLVDDRSKTFAVALMAEPASWCDARRAASVLALASESGRDVALIIHPVAQRRLDAIAWAGKLGLADRIILEDRLTEPWACMNGLDAVLMLSDDSNTMDISDRGNAFSLLLGGGRSVRPMPGIMPALWAMGAGVPVVAERSFALTEIIDDDGTGLLFDQHNINQAASKLVQLYEDRRLHRRISQAARAHVHQKYHVSAYCVRLKDVYERLIEGRLVRVVTDDSDTIEQGRRFSKFSR
ncbi:MAG: glycosyltransferase [Phycisphaerales bacterium]